MSDKTQEHVDTFWELIDEILNTVLFLLVGLELLVLPRMEMARRGALVVRSWCWRGGSACWQRLSRWAAPHPAARLDRGVHAGACAELSRWRCSSRCRRTIRAACC